MLRTPSPPEHDEKGSIVHVGEHPSFAKLLPSSHVSPPSQIPSPQTVQGPPVGGVGQVEKASIWQVESHPSLDTTFPSSHDSPASTDESPQIPKFLQFDLRHVEE